ncbi:MAG: DegT/DnrJ/EryC1/StrS family aminotransferase [Pseudomonadales bacterium]
MGARRFRRPAASRYIPFFKPWTDRREIGQVAGSIATGWLTTGPKVRQFEAGIKKLVGARHAVALNSCTAALHLSLLVAGVRRGDEVITSPYTFAATGEAIQYLGARPVFADIDPDTLNLDPDRVARAVTRRTRVILPVHVAGLPCEMKPLIDIARKRKLLVVEDAAHAIGAREGRRPIGSIGDLTCFSFYATKNLTAGEGGMVTTRRRRLAERIRLLSLHGLSQGAWERYSRSGSWRYDVLEVGFKYNMSDLAAGIGLAQLAKFRTMQARRRRLARRYTQSLRCLEALDLPVERAGATHAWHLYIVRLRTGVLRISRARVIECLARKGIGTSVHFLPLHLQSHYRTTYGYRRGSFPNAERESGRAISLPLYPGLSDTDQDRVVEVLADIERRYRR